MFGDLAICLTALLRRAVRQKTGENYFDEWGEYSSDADNAIILGEIKIIFEDGKVVDVE